MWSSLRMILLKYSLLQRNQSCEQQRTPSTPFWNSKDLFSIRSWVFSLSDALQKLLWVSAITAEETEVLCFLAQTSHFLDVTVLPHIHLFGHHLVIEHTLLLSCRRWIPLPSSCFLWELFNLWVGVFSCALQDLALFLRFLSLSRLFISNSPVSEQKGDWLKPVNPVWYLKSICEPELFHLED